MESNEQFLVLLKMAVCPVCDGSGSVPNIVAEYELVPPDMELEQCPWCSDRDKIFAGTLDHEQALEVLRAAVCPNCDGSGVILHQVSNQLSYITRDMALDAGDPDLEGFLYPEEQWEQEQCQWCYERQQIFDSIGI